MCTVSIVPWRKGVRLVCNRDERLARPEAIGPALRQVQRRTAMFPVDPLSGGTWIGVNDAGLVLALLNRTANQTEIDRPRQSRGIIVPALLAHDSLDAVVDAANQFLPTRFEPFRLVALHRSALAVIASDGRALSSGMSAIDQPVMFTSSSLGDWRVEPARGELFDRMVVRAPIAARNHAQTRFHRHHWPARPEISVRMARHDARTVSRTVVEISPLRVSLRYRPLPRVN